MARSRCSRCRTPSTGSNPSPSRRRAGEQISAGHFKPINSKRFVNDCHEYVFHLTKSGDVALDRRAAGVPYRAQIQHRPLGPHRRRGPPLPRQQLVHPLRDHQVPRQGPPAPRHLSRRARRAMHPPPRQGAGHPPARSVSRHRHLRHRRAPPAASQTSPASNWTPTISKPPASASPRKRTAGLASSRLAFDRPE